MKPNPLRFQIRPGLRQGVTTDLPIPTRLVSNEEFPPLRQTVAQQQVERAMNHLAETSARRLGLNRREFLRTTGGMAAAFLAMNSVFGRFFDVWAIELLDAAAAAERAGPAPFIFDVQTHYVGSRYDPLNAEASRKGAVSKDRLLALRQHVREMGWNPDLRRDKGAISDLSWENFVREVFLESDTSIALISTPPGPYPQEAVVPPSEMTHIRDEINRIAGSQRMLAHGLTTPQLGRADLDFMDMQVGLLKVDAWKCYTGSPPKGFDQGWWMDDEKIAYPMLERARALKIPRICVHKGLPLGPIEDYNHPRDLIKAAKDFPDIQFLVYHSGFRGMTGLQDGFRRTGEIPWTTEFCRMKSAEPTTTNLYMELGSTFGQLVSTQPELCAHLLGQILKAFGTDHVLWGTDSIWYGSPQWQLEAFRRFQIPDRLIERHGYEALTPDVKAEILGLNAARLFGLDVGAARKAVPSDFVGRIKMAYAGTPIHKVIRFYGWVEG
jgi:hypothetical protein